MHFSSSTQTPSVCSSCSLAALQAHWWIAWWVGCDKQKMEGQVFFCQFLSFVDSEKENTFTTPLPIHLSCICCCCSIGREEEGPVQPMEE